MSKNSMFRAGAMAALLALSAAGLMLSAVPGDAVAQSKDGWRKELADKAQQAQAAGQKGFGNGIEGEPVFWPGEAVPFIGVKNIGYRDTFGLHGADDLVRLSLLDSGIISALANEEGASNSIHIG